MHESKNYNRTEQLDALLSQMEEMEQELTEKDRETDSLQNQLQEKDQQLQMISSDNQKMKSQIESMNSVLSEQGQLLQKQTEQLVQRQQYHFSEEWAVEKKDGGMSAEGADHQRESPDDFYQSRGDEKGR
jgi:chromosome segregation ATPase